MACYGSALPLPLWALVFLSGQCGEDVWYPSTVSCCTSSDTGPLAVWLVEGSFKMAPGHEKVDLSLDSVAYIGRKKVNEFDSVMLNRKYVNVLVCPVLPDVQKSFVSRQPGFACLPS